MLDNIYQDRLKKLEKIRQLGVDPYGGRYDSAESIASVLGRFKDGDDAQRADAGTASPLPSRLTGGPSAGGPLASSL